MSVRVRLLLVALLLGGCGGADPGVETSAAQATAGGEVGQGQGQGQVGGPVSWEAEARWLPGEPVAVLHLELAGARELLPVEQMVGELLGPARARRAIEQVERIHVAVTMALAEPQLTLVVVGTPPLPADATIEQRAGRTVHVAGDEVWAEVGTRLWVGCLRHGCNAALIDPAARAEDQRAPGWALPEPGRTLELTLGMPRGAAGDELREYIRERMPGVMEAITRGQLALSPVDDGHVRLALAADFDLASIADNAAILLRVLAAGAAVSLEQLGQGEPARRLHGMHIGIDGRTLGAELTLRKQGARLLAHTAWAAYQASRAGPQAEPTELEAEERYAPPAADVRAQRLRQARRDRALAPLLDAVLATAGDDVQRIEGAGGSYLEVYVERARAGQTQPALERALAGEAVVLRTARGYGERPAVLGVFVARDGLAALKVLGTGGARAGAVRAVLGRWQREHGLSITLANADYLALQLQRTPADPAAVVDELLTFCPGASQKSQLKQLQQERTLDCFFR